MSLYLLSNITIGWTLQKSRYVAWLNDRRTLVLKFSIESEFFELVSPTTMAL